jgi:hypothetical protein
MKSTLARDLRVHDTLPHRDAPKVATVNGIKIDKGVPIPTTYRSGTCPYPFAEMGVGDSFAIPVPLGEQPKVVAGRIRARVEWWKKQAPGFHAAIRVEQDGKAVRCWRVAEAPSKARKK